MEKAGVGYLLLTYWGFNTTGITKDQCVKKEREMRQRVDDEEKATLRPAKTKMGYPKLPMKKFLYESPSLFYRNMLRVFFDSEISQIQPGYPIDNLWLLLQKL